MKPQFENTQAQRISRASRAPSQYGSGRRRCLLRAFFGPEQLVKSLVLGAVLAMAAFAIRANATPDSLLIIGDSISDDGKLAVLFPSRAPPAPYYWNARFSNGPSYAELLHARLGVAQDMVFNFAIGGARSGLGGARSTFPIDALDQVALAVGSGAVSPDGLVVYFIGANDLAALLEGDLPGVTPEAHVTTVNQNIATGIGQLAAAGQRRFVLIDVPDLGATPAVAGLGPTVSGLASELTAAYNTALRQTAGRLESELGIDVAVVSFDDLFEDILENSPRYGLTNTSVPCFIFNHSRRDLPPQPTGACPGVEEADPEAAADTLYWDPFHPTARVQAFAAEFLAANVDVLAEGGADIVSRARLGSLAASAQQRLVESRLSASSVQDATRSAEHTTSNGTTVYLTASYREGAREGAIRQRGFDFSANTFMLGVERALGRAGLAGAALGRSTGSLSLDDDRGESDFEGTFVNLYGLFDLRNADGRGAYVGVAGGTSQDRHDLTRPTGFSPYPTASADPDGTTMTFLVTGGYDFRSGEMVYGPVLGGRWARSTVDSYTEDAGPIALTVTEQDFTSQVAIVGGRFERRPTTDSAQALPYARLVIEHEMNGDDVLWGMLPSGEPVSGQAEDAGTSLVMNGGIRLRVRDSISAHLGAEAAIRRGSGTDFGVSGQLAIRF